MLTKFLTITAVSALMLSPALAQTPTMPPAGSTAPAATPAPSGSMTAPSSSAVGSSGTIGTQYVAKQDTNHWLVTKFMGTDVMGDKNERIGDVRDMLFDKDGKISAVLVGVGGFLGIGEKNVAIDLKSFQWDAGDAADMNDDKLKLSMTFEQLKDAPAFEAYKLPARTTGRTTGPNTGTSSGPAGTPGTTR